MPWKILAKALKLTGGVTFIGLCCVELYLIFHWRAVRPYSPRSALGWTARLPWCLGAYGTVHEAHLLNSIATWSEVAFAAIAAGVGIDYFKFGVWPLKAPLGTQKRSG